MVYKIGDKAHGGIVFYVDDTGKHGLVAAEKDQNTGANWTTAEEICLNLDLEGYKDWFLPSKSELNLMYGCLHREGLGGFAAAWYWSSKEADSVNVWNQYFGNGTWSNNTRDSNLHVRAIRAF